MIDCPYCHGTTGAKRTELVEYEVQATWDTIGEPTPAGGFGETVKVGPWYCLDCGKRLSRKTLVSATIGASWVTRYVNGGHTMREVADNCGVSLKTVYRWRDGTMPHGGRFGAIEAMTGKTIQELIPEVFDPTR